MYFFIERFFETDEQNQACLNFAMSLKRGPKANVFLRQMSKGKTIMPQVLSFKDSSGRCPSDILLPFQGAELCVGGSGAFTRGGALGYVLLPLRGDSPPVGGLNVSRLRVQNCPLYNCEWVELKIDCGCVKQGNCVYVRACNCLIIRR